MTEKTTYKQRKREIRAILKDVEAQIKKVRKALAHSDKNEVQRQVETLQEFGTDAYHIANDDKGEHTLIRTGGNDE